MSRRYSWPDGHWGWPIALTHKHGVRAGHFAFTGGQAALDQDGRVLHPDDLDQQVGCVANYLLAILHDLEVEAADLVRLVVYFVGDGDDEARMLDLLHERLGPTVCPAVNTVPVPALCYPGMRIELEGVALRSDTENPLSRRNIRLDTRPALPAGYAHAVVCGGLIFTSDVSAITPEGDVAHPGDITRQTERMMQQLSCVLDAAGAGFDDCLKLNTFYVGDGTAENWAKPALIRQACFTDPGPAATGITLPALAHPGLMTKIAATAVSRRDANGVEIAAPPRRFSWPDGHWDWTTTLPYKHGNRLDRNTGGHLIHLGGQVSLDSAARVIDPDDTVAQTRRALAYIETVLADLGASMDDVVKVTTFYRGDASAEALHDNLNIRSRAFTEPGPATSGIPVPCLVYEHMCIEIEVIAVLD